MMAEVVGKRGEKFGMRRRICRTEVVHRIDNAASEELAPYPIHSGFGEVGVRRHPSREFFARVCIGSKIDA